VVVIAFCFKTSHCAGSVAAISKSMERAVAQRLRQELKQTIHKLKSSLMVGALVNGGLLH
jgi:hypothetical protein